MIRPRAIVRNKQLIYNGFFIASANETVAVMPFDDDPEYKFRFTVRIDPDDRVRNVVATAADEILDIDHYRPEKLVLPTASRRKETFAHDATYNYYINFSVMHCRSPAGTVYQVNYTILREPV